MLKTIARDWGALLIAAVLTLFSASMAWADDPAAFVADDGNKSIAVSDVPGVDDEIQQAIDYIVAKTDSSQWTVNVSEGTYDRFTVPHWNSSGIEGLRVIGSSAQEVTVNVLDESYAGDLDNGGINVYGKDVTLKNLTVAAGTSKQKRWSDAAISTLHAHSGGLGISLTVDNCVISGPGAGLGATYGIFWSCSGMSVINCKISGFSNAIEYMNDNFNVPAGETYLFSGNTITGASFAFHGYMGGGNGLGEIDFSNNVVTGTESLRSKVIAQDNVEDSFVVDIHDNVFENVVVGLVNLKDEGDVVSDVLGSNDMGDGCFYVEAIEPGTIELYTTFEAASEGDGYWALTGLDDFDVDWGKNPEGSAAFVYDLVKQANLSGSRTLSITGIDEENLVKTFTWFKDGLYWITGNNPYLGSLSISKQVKGEDAPADVFTFVVNADVEDGEYACAYGKDDSAGGAGGTIMFKDREAVVHLKAGESIEIEGLPAGTPYSVRELPADNYSTSVAAVDDDDDYVIEGLVISGVIDEVEVDDRYVVTSDADDDAVVFTNEYSAASGSNPSDVDGDEGGEPEEPAAKDAVAALPQTGDSVPYVLAGIGVLAVLAVAVCLFARRKLS